MYIILNLHGIAYKVEFNTSISLMSEYIWEELINKSKVKNLTEPVLLLLFFSFLSPITPLSLLIFAETDFKLLTGLQFEVTYRNAVFDRFQTPSCTC